jgi:L-2-hydroxyglutarate oxidase
MHSSQYELAIIGGGIIGLATGLTLVSRGNNSLIVVEAEEKLAAHQTGHNSGVIHSGLYYTPGSLKAKNCVAGREALYQFCERHGIYHERCGKIVVATRENEIPFLNELERRGKANGLQDIKRLGKEEINEYEPHAAGLAGLYVDETGIVDYLAVAEKFAGLIQEGGGAIQKNARVAAMQRNHNELRLETNSGEICCRNLINCAGLHSDRIAKLCGLNPGLMIVPFRGEYYELTQDSVHLVKNMIYPTPDPRFPFLGAHFTRMIQGGIEAGPNAVLALKREGYSRWDFSPRDAWETFTYGGALRLFSTYWKTGFGEIYRSLSKKAFVTALQKLVPEISPDDVMPAGAGVRAQAVASDGSLVDDFRILESERMIHVLNAPSPGATASLSIGETIAGMAVKNFGLL